MSTSTSTTPLDIIKAALRRCQSYQSGEQLAGVDVQDCLDSYNDLIASLNTGETAIPGVVENIVQWKAGQNIYNVGNPLCTELGFQPFQAVATSGSNVLAAVGTPPANLAVGAWLIDSQGVIPAGLTNSTSYVSSQATPNPTTVVSISGPNITMSAPATANSGGNTAVTYSVPGDFLPAFTRPLMITSGYTRFSQLDFTLDVYESEEEYNAVLYKAQPGPWPTAGWYNYSQPYGQLRVYQTPGNGAELHLFTKVVLSDLLPTQPVLLPPGYFRYLKWMMVREIWAEYVNPNTFPAGVEKLAKESEAAVKQINARPPRRAMYERELLRGHRADAGWIFHGGYR